MATPGEFVKRLAEITGIPQASLTIVDRNIAAAGLRSKGGRGNSAAQLTTSDAANELIGAMCSLIGYQVKDLGKIVADFRAFENFHLTDQYIRKGLSDYRKDLEESGLISEMVTDPRMRTFGGAFDITMELIANRKLKAYFLECQRAGRSSPFEMNITLLREHSPSARIDIVTPKGAITTSYSYPLPKDWGGGLISNRPEEEKRFRAKVAKNHPPQLIRTSARVTERELILLGVFMSPETV